MVEPLPSPAAVLGLERGWAERGVPFGGGSAHDPCDGSTHVPLCVGGAYTPAHTGLGAGTAACADLGTPCSREWGWSDCRGGGGAATGEVLALQRSYQNLSKSFKAWKRPEEAEQLLFERA